jgi:uncharacterized protein YqhQ
LSDTSDPPKEIQIGGQAIIEGVVMRGPESWALAVRRPDGDIHVEVNPVGTLAQRYPRANHFPIRGMFALADSLVIGIKALTISGGISLQDEEIAQPAGEKDEALAGGDIPGKRNGKVGKPQELSAPAVALSITLALALFLGIFIVMPAVITRYLQPYLPNTVLYNLVEGGLRIAIFILYLAVVGLVPDVRRVFQYHGAEHKVVHAYEAGTSLEPGSTRSYSTAHMRCGTAFIVIVFIVSILVFSLLGRPPLPIRILERLAIIPLVAAISYEIIRFAGRHETSVVVRLFMAPGLLFQKLTTREPDESQLEVAARSLQAALGEIPFEREPQPAPVT